MQNLLYKNIRALRRQNGLTQEQLAEAMEVSVGAVSKWEQASSMPEIPLLMKLADYFQTSVDALLGYEMLNNGRGESIQRLKNYLHLKTYDGIWSDVEKTLTKYPNSFEIIHQCAKLYHMCGMEHSDKRRLRKAVELYERACQLIGQNQDASVSELSIQISIAEAYLSLGDTKNALQYLKAHNPCGINDGLIGSTLAGLCHEPDQALPYLSDALLSLTAQIMRVVGGYVSAYEEKKDYASGLAITSWLLLFLSGLKLPDQTCFLEKAEARILAICGCFALSMGDTDRARDYLKQARQTALRFDAAPDYDGRRIRFYCGAPDATVYDDMGQTAMDSLQTILIENQHICGLSALWKEVTQDENNQ